MKIRITKPGAADKYYIRKKSGGYSTCIQGKPTDENCDVLSNCVGYACGAFNEEHEFGYEKYHLNCNAENFIERAIASGLSVVKDPVPGGIMVWRRGTLSNSDGAGHVAICTEEIVKGSTEAEDYVITSDSSYGGKAFLRIKRKRGAGNWGANSKYTYRGCIVPEGYKPTPKPEPTPEPQPEPKPTPANELKVGDKVKIIATGNGSAYGTSNKAYGLGWTRYITKIYEGKPFPYQVGNKGKTDSKNTTGFYAKSALQKID